MTKTRQPLILVVEDDDACRDLMEEILTMNGYAVRVACNGLEALKTLELEQPDLILLDVKMPVMNGWEFSRRMRAEQRPHVTTMIVSAAEDIQARAQEIGADNWLEKPFELENLLAKVELMLKRV
ncbi:response regulator transcription factor [Oligoflexus tunisiensis]|uniref:response regulator transcription factor n=1 Tax=Oligoflexus tunisiensis TaxID=708132 RepID=UPI00114CFCD7|nr:response regulator transcription factor [Oligoflexus tunisiensis]